MRKTVWLWLAVTLPAPARADWLRANFHGHTAPTLVIDDGSETPLELHQALRQAGFDFSVHSVHSSHNKGPEAVDRWKLEQAVEDALDVPGLTFTLGEELTVAAGPRYQSQTRILGRPGPGNLDHMTLFGIHTMVPTETPLAEACRLAHADGGVCIVNHPGPGPMMWEEGLWEQAENRAGVDAIEVYNGEAMAVMGFDFEARYLEATAYRKLGMKIAAVTGADTHGPDSYQRSRRSLKRFGPATKLLSLVLPNPTSARPELDAATLLHSSGRAERDVVAAVKTRRTIATWALPNLRVECPGLGEVKPSGDVALKLELSRKVAEVTLYREGTAVRTWTDAREAAWQEHIDGPAAYVFGVKDGRGRLMTSAIWYEPPRR